MSVVKWGAGRREIFSVAGLSGLFAPDSLPSRGCKGIVYFGEKKALFFFISAPDLVIYCLAFREVFDSKGKRERRRSRV